MSASRAARPTIRFVDEYCQLYEDLFPEVRSFEAFKFLHLGMISEIKRKSLPAIALIGWLRSSTKLTSLLNRITLDSTAIAAEKTGTDPQGTGWQDIDSVN